MFFIFSSMIVHTGSWFLIFSMLEIKILFSKITRVISKVRFMVVSKISSGHCFIGKILSKLCKLTITWDIIKEMLIALVLMNPIITPSSGTWFILSRMWIEVTLMLCSIMVELKIPTSTSVIVRFGRVPLLEVEIASLSWLLAEEILLHAFLDWVTVSTHMGEGIVDWLLRFRDVFTVSICWFMKPRIIIEITHDELIIDSMLEDPIWRLMPRFAYCWHDITEESQAMFPRFIHIKFLKHDLLELSNILF